MNNTKANPLILVSEMTWSRRFLPLCRFADPSDITASYNYDDIELQLIKKSCLCIVVGITDNFAELAVLAGLANDRRLLESVEWMAVPRRPSVGGHPPAPHALAGRGPLPNNINRHAAYNNDSALYVSILLFQYCVWKLKINDTSLEIRMIVIYYFNKFFHRSSV